jgi:hypothetical protein
MAASFLATIAGCDLLDGAECHADADCAGSDLCDDGACVECARDADCDDDEECNDGECEAAGEGEGEGEGEREPGGPEILQLSTNVTTLDETGTLVVTAVVTDPDGVDDVIGGSLRAPDGATYGAFTTSAAEGAYEIRVDWFELHAVAAIEFTDSATRAFEAEFFDQGGARATRGFSVTLACSGGGGVCDGDCGLVRCRPDAGAGQCSAVCAPESGGQCDDAIDNDADGFLDCDDFDCAETCDPAAPEDDLVSCSDGDDNDNDGFVDCDDFDCDGLGACGAEDDDALCSDLVSNDSDSFVDCADFDCSRNIAVSVCGATSCGLDVGGGEGTLFFGTPTGPSRSAGSCGGDGPEQLVAWQVPLTGTWQLSVGAAGATVLYGRDSCGGVEQFCVDGAAGATLALSAGDVLLLGADIEGSAALELELLATLL